MNKFIETIKRKTTCDPNKDKDCKCEDQMESGVEKNKPIITNKRVCTRAVIK